MSQRRIDFEYILLEALTLWIKKDKDYGPNNIAVMGYQGVLATVHSKIQRLINIDLQGYETNESEEDSLLDNINYLVMALMLKRGLWPKLDTTNAAQLIDNQIEHLQTLKENL